MHFSSLIGQTQERMRGFTPSSSVEIFFTCIINFYDYMIDQYIKYMYDR